MSRTGLSEEARFELAMGASARERRNRPRHLVYLAAILVLAGGVAALAEARSWSKAAGGARAALARQAEVASQVREFVELRAKSGGVEKERTGFDKMVSTGERTAEAAGLNKPAKPLEPPTPDIRGNLVHRTWRYTKIKSAEAGPLLEWVRTMLEEMPGLRVSSIRLAPGEQGWTMDVTYAGVEPVGGGS
jgi:hypothetical protein